jgi:hypothetical protein
MQALGKALGEAQPNDVHGVTLVPAAQTKIARPATKGRAAGHYLSRYDGTFANGTTEAMLPLALGFRRRHTHGR